MGNPRRAFLVFDGYAYPYVRGRASVGIAAIHIVPEPRAPLGQDLVRVPIGRLHRVEYPIDEGCRYGLMEEIAHRVYENHPSTAPAQWLIQALGPEGQVKPVFEGMARHSTEPLGEARGIAVIASSGDLRATCDGVPRSVGPLYCAVISHCRSALPRLEID